MPSGPGASGTTTSPASRASPFRPWGAWTPNSEGSCWLSKSRATHAPAARDLQIHIIKRALTGDIHTHASHYSRSSIKWAYTDGLLPYLLRKLWGLRCPSGGGPYLRTGDLGVIGHDGVRITGRLKDVLVVRGTKHHPQDLERTAEGRHRAVRPGCVAAFVANHCSSGDGITLVAESIRTSSSPPPTRRRQSRPSGAASPTRTASS